MPDAPSYRRPAGPPPHAAELHDAALDYLEDLYADFGDWHLAMAAYNCGEGRVRRHLRANPGQPYWDMSLPKETRYYVPKILAAMTAVHTSG